MSKRAFGKPALTHSEQIGLLVSRGLIVEDQLAAEFYLRHLNYYRLAGYWFPLERDHKTHEFKSGASFSKVLSLYVFDRELRLLILDAIERVEVSVRSVWAYEVAHKHGPHAHLDGQLAKDQRRWRKNLGVLSEEVKRSDELFIKHYRSAYSESLPPVWAVCEVMSLGMLSRWFSNLGPSATRTAIAATFGVDATILQSWLRHLSYVRNLCAHHARLWNRELTITPGAPRTKPVGLGGQFVVKSRRIYNTLVILLYLMDVIAPAHTWRTRIRDLIENGDSKPPAMGFPDAWEQRSIWHGQFGAAQLQRQGE